jgi:hypothetical protein
MLSLGLKLAVSTYLNSSSKEWELVIVTKEGRRKKGNPHPYFPTPRVQIH